MMPENHVLILLEVARKLGPGAVARDENIGPGFNVRSVLRTSSIYLHVLRR